MNYELEKNNLTREEINDTFKIINDSKTINDCYKKSIDEKLYPFAVELNELVKNYILEIKNLGINNTRFASILLFNCTYLKNDSNNIDLPEYFYNQRRDLCRLMSIINKRTIFKIYKNNITIIDKLIEFCEMVTELKGDFNLRFDIIVEKLKMNPNHKLEKKFKLKSTCDIFKRHKRLLNIRAFISKNGNLFTKYYYNKLIDDFNILRDK